MKFSRQFGYGTIYILEHFEDVGFNSLCPGLIFLFSRSMLDGNITQKRVNRFSWNFQDMLQTTQNIIDKTVSCLTRLFHGPPSRRDGVPVSNITVKWVIGFWLNFKDMSGVKQGTISNILLMLRLTTVVQDIFFYFLDPCLLAILRNNGWMDIHNFFSIWIQGAIC